MDTKFPKLETGFLLNYDMNEELLNRLIRKVFGIKSTKDLMANSGTFRKEITIENFFIFKHVPVESRKKSNRAKKWTSSLYFNIK